MADWEWVDLPPDDSDEAHEAWVLNHEGDEEDHVRVVHFVDVEEPDDE